MIQLISREEYYNHISQDTDYHKLFSPLNFSFDFPEHYTEEMYFLVDNAYYIVYIFSLSFVLIPAQYDVEEIKKRILNSESRASMTDWVITKISDDTSFTLNTFMKYDFEILMSGKDVESIKGENKGSWNLINERTGEIINFELLSAWETTQYVRKYIAFAEKEAIPMDKEKVAKKSKFIELLIHGCKKSV